MKLPLKIDIYNNPLCVVYDANHQPITGILLEIEGNQLVKAVNEYETLKQEIEELKEDIKKVEKSHDIWCDKYHELQQQLDKAGECLKDVLNIAWFEYQNNDLDMVSRETEEKLRKAEQFLKEVKEAHNGKTRV